MDGWIQPGVTIAAIIALWRLIHADIKALREDLGSRIDRLNERIDRHLEGHP